MSKPDPFITEETLPDPLPAEPFGLFRDWFDAARSGRVQPNPDAMTLATVDPDGRPSARIVLCKAIDTGLGRVTFYTNRESRKGRAIDADPHVALVMHWDALDRQVRIEGVASRASDAESDGYFASRRVESRLGAWASAQSRPLSSRDELLARVAETMERFGVTLDDLERGLAEIPRPPHWGGYHVLADTVELWIGGVGRIHDRARWTRSISGSDAGAPGPWSATRLFP